MFWYLGMLPDLAAMRDRAQDARSGGVFYGLLALGWRNSVAHWWRLEKAYMLLAGLATPLVVSVHTVVSFDFAVAIVPGWHSTVFPPYFVAGAIYSGFAMVLILAIPLRSIYGLQDFVTDAAPEQLRQAAARVRAGAQLRLLHRGGDGRLRRRQVRARGAARPLLRRRPRRSTGSSWR